MLTSFWNYLSGQDSTAKPSAPNAGTTPAPNDPSQVQPATPPCPKTGAPKCCCKK